MELKSTKEDRSIILKPLGKFEFDHELFYSSLNSMDSYDFSAARCLLTKTDMVKFDSNPENISNLKLHTLAVLFYASFSNDLFAVDSFVHYPKFIQLYHPSDFAEIIRRCRCIAKELNYTRMQEILEEVSYLDMLLIMRVDFSASVDESGKNLVDFYRKEMDASEFQNLVNRIEALKQEEINRNMRNQFYRF